MKDPDNNFQRKGASSNSDVGRVFEQIVATYFMKKHIRLDPGQGFALGLPKRNKKLHRFDLASRRRKIIVECKSHKWTAGGYVPSAKMTVWNEAMYYFSLAPKKYRKMFFVLRDYNKRVKMTLAEYYLKNYSHLIPADVELYEVDEKKSEICKLT